VKNKSKTDKGVSASSGFTEQEHTNAGPPDSSAIAASTPGFRPAAWIMTCLPTRWHSACLYPLKKAIAAQQERKGSSRGFGFGCHCHAGSSRKSKERGAISVLELESAEQDKLM